MKKNILVPVDFSETSATAAQWGFQLAEQLGYDLKIIHVSDLVLSGTHSLTTPEQKKDEAELAKKLKAFSQKIIPLAKLPAKEQASSAPRVNLSLLTGVAAYVIKQLSKKSSTAFIVIGGVGSGSGPNMPGIYGSVATPVATHSACPVILIPKGFKPLNIFRMAIAFDTPAEVQSYGQLASLIVNALKPELRYVHVSHPDWAEEIVLEEDFITLTLGSDFSDYPFKFDVLPEGDVVERLTAYTEQKGIDLLVLGRKKRGFWQRLFEDRNLKPIIKALKVPTLIIPFSEGSI